MLWVTVIHFIFSSKTLVFYYAWWITNFSKWHYFSLIPRCKWSLKCIGFFLLIIIVFRITISSQQVLLFFMLQSTLSDYTCTLQVDVTFVNFYWIITYLIIYGVLDISIKRCKWVTRQNIIFLLQCIILTFAFTFLIWTLLWKSISFDTTKVIQQLIFLIFIVAENLSILCIILKIIIISYL